MNIRSTPDWVDLTGPSPYAFRVVDVPPGRAAWALEWGYAVGTQASGTDRWLVNAGEAQLHVDRLIRPAVVSPATEPLLILQGRFVRRWMPIPIEVELSRWSAHRSQLAVRTVQAPLRHGWYFRAAAASLRSLAGETTAWAAAAFGSDSSVPGWQPRPDGGHGW